MIINKFALLARRFRRPAEGDGTGDGAGVDRGDDFTPTEEDEEAEAAAAAAAAAKKDKPLPKSKAAAKAELEGGESDEDDEDDAPDDETEEEKAAREAAEAAKKNKRIPLKRHEAILNRERERREAAELALKGYEGQRTVVKTNEEISTRETKITELETDLAKAQADGEHAKVAKLMGDIRKLDREIVQLDAQSKIAAAEARAIESARFTVTLERIEAAYPELNEDHEEFDQEVYDDVLELVNAYKAQGRTPSDALQRAVRMKFGAATARQKAATTTKARVDVDDPEVAARIRAEKKATATDKALKAAKQPPTATAKTGINSNDAGASRTAKDVIKMSQSEFAKLDDKELARLRGDEVAAE